MTLYEYISLSIDAKANELWQHGLFIQGHRDGSNSFNLYFMHGFYVEVTMDNTSMAILHITPFKRGHLLDKYIDAITLDLKS